MVLSIMVPNFPANGFRGVPHVPPTILMSAQNYHSVGVRVVAWSF